MAAAASMSRLFVLIVTLTDLLSPVVAFLPAHTKHLMRRIGKTYHEDGNPHAKYIEVDDEGFHDLGTEQDEADQTSFRDPNLHLNWQLAQLPPSKQAIPLASERSSLSLLMKSSNASTQCGKSFFGPSVPEGQSCPSACPFWAGGPQGTSSGDAAVSDHTAKHCYFTCVTDTGCAVANPDLAIADEDGMYCRGCMIEGCAHCASGTNDQCQACQDSYTLTFAKGCSLNSSVSWYAAYAIIGSILLFFLVCYLDLRCRSFTNKNGLKRGVSKREGSKLCMPPQNDSEASEAAPSDPASRTSSQPLVDHAASTASTSSVQTSINLLRKLHWPLKTNLLRTDVAGIGTTLYFRSMTFVVVWGFLLGLCWAIAAAIMDTELFRLGIQAIDTPRQLCDNVHWGYTVQHKLMWVKVVFVFAAYGVTLIMTIAHSVRQRQQFHKINNQTSMKDFAALCYGDFQGIKGSDNIEEDLHNAIEAGSEQRVVGVSVCWNYADKEDDVIEQIERDLYLEDQRNPHRSPLMDGGEQDEGADEPEATESKTKSPEEEIPEPESRERFIAFRAMDWVFAWIMLGVRSRHLEPVTEEGDPATVQSLLHDLETLDRAYVVFESEKSRDLAVSTLNTRAEAQDTTSRDDETSGSRLGKLRLEVATCEPEEVLWQNLGYSRRVKAFWLMVSIAVTLSTLLVWSFGCFYPYAQWMSSYSYSMGSEPCFFASFVFSLVVVLGNELMFLVVTFTVDKVGLHNKDTCETIYLVLYSIGCFLGLLVDLGVTSYVVYKTAVGMKLVNHAGKLLSELPTGREVFESYPMQKAMGHELFLFAFPPCFLLPFVLEPILTIYVPWHISRLLVGTNPKIKGRAAEKYLEIVQEMELARYADLILNMMLATFIFLFPGGYTLMMFGAFVGSHIYILLLDHYRVLRCVPTFRFDSHYTDTTANMMMALPTGCLLVCAIYKTFSIPGYDDLLGDSSLIAICSFAFFFHLVVHIGLLLTLVPYLGRWYHQQSDLSYPDAAAKMPCTFFAANPIHCLRSKYKFKHEPPCTFFTPGKQHLMRANPEIGIYYETKAGGGR